MLIFTIDSLRPVFTLFENKISIENNEIFFNDKIKLRKVVSYNPIERHFDVNGMSEAHVIGYNISLIDDLQLRLQVKGDSIEVSPFHMI